MASAQTSSPRASQLADRLTADIEVRGLKAGDRYLTTTEAAALLGVGNGAANRALQVLERRRRIVRQQRRGAYVVDPHQTKEGPPLHRVHFLVHQKYLRAEGVGQDESLLGIERELPGVPVQISFLPVSNEAEFVEELLDESSRSKRQVGFVLVRASYETQRLLAERHVPTVVFGTLYSSIDRLASLSADMRAVGVELTKFLLKRGHERFAHFNRQIAYGGDQLTIDGIASTLQESGKGFDSLVLRFLPDAEEVYAAEARKLVESAAHPTAFICRTVRMADAVRKVAEAKGLAVGKDVDIVVCDYYLKPGNQPHYVFAKPLLSSEDQGRHLARLLIAQVSGLQSFGGRIGHEVMPIELAFPVANER